MMTIKKFSIEYDAINNKNVFSNGDTVNGRIIVWASKDSRICSLAFLACGAADVSWMEDEDRCISNNEIYYNAMHYIIEESRGGAPTVIDKGRHIFPFSFKFPDRNVPTSFTSNIGNIRHVLQAKLKEFKKRTRWIQTIIRFLSKTDCNIPRLMEPVHDNKMKIFKLGSGSVLMNASIERQGFKEGDTLYVMLIVNNCSGRKVRPKFTLCHQQTFTAQYETQSVSHKIMRKKYKVVKPNTLKTMTMAFDISNNLPPTALNCSFIKLRYWVEVSLDIPFAENLKIMLPIVILPSFHTRTTESLAAAAGLETVGSSIPTQWSGQRAAAPPEEPPPAYEDCVMDTY